MDTAIAIPALNVRALLKKYALTLRKGLGQNFLIDEIILQEITQAAEINAENHVLEIGAGLGGLTRWLAASAKRVAAVEMDVRLIPLLQEVMKPYDNVHIISGDILQLVPASLMGADNYIVAANIPYYITSALFRHLLEAEVKPQRMVLTVQREVAERICAQPGELSLLALSVQVYGAPKPILKIPAAAFYPIPKVDSMTLRVDLYTQPLIPLENLDAFFKLIKAGFSQKRKMLHNALSSGLAWPHEKVEALLKNSDVDPHRRAQTLSIDEWRSLTSNYLQEK